MHWSLLLLLLVTAAAAGKGEPPRINYDAPTRFRIALGTKQFKFACPVDPPDQDVMIQWLRNGESLDDDPTYKVSKDQRELKIKNVELENSGSFQCKVVNGFGHDKVNFLLQVFDPLTDVLTQRDRITLSNNSSPPYWLDEEEMMQATSSPIRINLGGRLELRCAARGNPLPEIMWYRNDEQILPTGPLDSAVFQMEGVMQEHSGEYRCVVSNMLGEKQATHKVLVADFFDAAKEDDGVERVHQEEFVPYIDNPANITVVSGRTATFMCKARASTAPVIKWLKELIPGERERMQRIVANATFFNADGRDLTVVDETQQQGKETIHGESYYTNKLVIPETQQKDEGRYICVVTSNLGHIVYRTAHLTIESGGDLRIGDIKITPGIFWYVAIPLLALVLIFVVFGICWLRTNREREGSSTDSTIKTSSSRGGTNSNSQPPPPRIPPPVAPADSVIGMPPSGFPHAVPAHMHFGLDGPKPQSPLMLRDSMFQQQLARGGATMERMHTPQRQHRGLHQDDMQHSPHFSQSHGSAHHLPSHASPQGSPMYWTGHKSAQQPLLMAAQPQLIDPPHHLPRGHHTLGHHHHHHHHTVLPSPSYQMGYPPSSNYRTLDMPYGRDPHPSVYSEYTDSVQFLVGGGARRVHEL